MKTSVDHLYKSMQSKANIQDVCALVDVKANCEDVNQAIYELGQ